MVREKEFRGCANNLLGWNGRILFIEERFQNPEARACTISEPI